ncbi:MAG: efflux RND transporter periplasmic adaptor subunit [Gammaproteobacteria bacterium]|nr:efflux RND transporter periplasmic adaptor subunit [Gammaproteobacteria bacterium]MXZ27234.1 efflux RND transporter periplasmic adaptor subunit [Gammaproteobacteria bacterium]MYF58863.1 efflux RND transporter periplasmic adaptor subunit [Gammaproteobacteria bacterium]MYH33923.1 efflux RND transporter periplasmic adaptor subunit [Gammaproteobacteria bacterium]
MNFLALLKRYFGPVLIVAGGFLLAIVIVATGPRPDRQARPPDAPSVLTIPALKRPAQLSVKAHGTVVPKTESNLVAEVAGRIVAVSPSMVSGGFFSRGDMLLEIERIDYEAALEQARAALASAESELANAELTFGRAEELAATRAVSQADLDQALNQLNVSRAGQRQASAALAQAERDLERTRVTAPYDGRVRSERVDTGQFVSRGESIATLYSIDYAEVRLPIKDQDLAFLPFSLARTDSPSAVKTKAILRAEFAGGTHAWEADVVRTEGELDPLSRVVNVIAQVAEPYEPADGSPPLTVGLFVEADIIGNTIEDVVVVPTSALQTGNRIYVVDTGNRLSFRDAEVVRLTAETAYLRVDVADGEQICVTGLDDAVEGQSVRPAPAPPAPAAPG